MKDFVVVIWDFKSSSRAPEALAMLERCGLRRIAEQEAGAMYDEALEEFVPLSGYGTVRLAKDDPRLQELLSELESAKVQPFIRAERKYERHELDAAPWLWTAGGTSMVLAGNKRGQQWSMSGACEGCGAGAVPVPPLIATFERPSKSGWCMSVPYGLVIVSADVAAHLVSASLTGFEIHAVRTPSRKVPDGRYRWLKVTAQWPRYAPATVTHMDEPCPLCDRPGRFETAKRVSELHYDAVPVQAMDFNSTFEQWGYAVFKHSTNKPVGASPGLIISQRARTVLQEAGAKIVGLHPVFIAGRFGPETDPPTAKPGRVHRR